MSHLKRLREAGAQESDLFSTSDSLPPVPDNFNRAKFDRGRQFFLDNYFSCVFAMLVSLVCGLSVDRLLNPLVFTRLSDTPRKAFLRYLKTMYYVYLWHAEDVWDPSSQAHETLAKVRRMHTSAHVEMTKARDGNHPSISSDTSTVPVSQYDMSLVQCGFMGSIVMYPDSCGIRCTMSHLSDYCYFWRCIGFLLGIKDDNNICRGSVEETIGICREIESNVLLPALRDPPADFHPMAKAVTDGINMSTKVSLLSVESFLAVAYSTMGVSYPPLSWTDHLRMVFLKSLLLFVKYVPCCRALFNKVFVYPMHQVAKIPKLRE